MRTSFIVLILLFWEAMFPNVQLSQLAFILVIGLILAMIQDIAEIIG